MTKVALKTKWVHAEDEKIKLIWVGLRIQKIMDEQKCQKKLGKHSKFATIEDMPNEVLEKIFHQLSMYEVQHNLALVSKQFLKVSRIPGMVDNIKIIIGPGKITDVYKRTIDKKNLIFTFSCCDI